jgi:uncharacterized protein YjiS (DUF1127 family)
MRENQLLEMDMFNLSSFLASFRRARIRNSAVHALRGLSSEQLADLGIASDGIGEVVDGLIANRTASGAPTRFASSHASIGRLGLRAAG